MSAPDAHLAAAVRILGAQAAGSDRALLGLPAEGELRSGQIEAAFEARLDQIARHPAARSSEARHLAVACEHAADRLQGDLALRGRAPLHPKAAARAARRIAEAEQKIAERAARKAAVVAPQATLEPGVGLSAADLTDFDRLAMAILVVSGGWNARSAKRLACIAEEHGVSVDDLDRVVRGLTNYLSSGGGFSSDLGDIGSSARSVWMQGGAVAGADRAERAVERVLGRINDAIHDEVASGSTGSQVRIASIFVAIGLLWISALGWLFFAPVRTESQEAAGTLPELASAADDPRLSESSGPDGRPSAPTGANGELIAPPPLLAAPAKYPRPPGFRPAALPASVVEAAGGAAGWLEKLDDASLRTRAARGQPDESTYALVADTLAGAAGSWPAAGAYREEVVSAFGKIARTTREGEPLRRLMTVVPGSDADIARRGLRLPDAMWHRAFGAGILASVAVDPTQTPEAAAAAREEMRLRAIEIPRGQVGDAFATGVASALSREAVAIADGLSIGTIAGLDEASRWVRALEGATVDPGIRSRAALGAIDAVLRAPGAIDTPGPLVDFLAHAIQMLDMSGRTAESESVRDAIAAVLVDRNIPSPRAWVFTSLLDADLGVAWYGPDLVIATNAAMRDREEAAARMVAAFPKPGVTAIGGAVLVESSRLDAWRRQEQLIRGLNDADAADRLRTLAATVHAMRAARAFETGDQKTAQAAEERSVLVAGRAAAEWEASPTGERSGLPATGSGDGEFEAAWNGSKDTPSRLDLVRALAARPAEGDLGPRDARVVARESLRNANEELRQALASLVVTRYASGRQVLRAMLDELADGPSRPRTVEFLSALVGAPVAGPNWVGEARARIIERVALLEDSRDHAVDAAAAEFASACAMLAEAYGGGAVAGAAGSSSRPSAACSALADAMREEARTRFLSSAFPSSIEEIERRRVVRRSVAAGESQAIAAEAAAILEYAAMLVVSRQPALESKVGEMLATAVRARAAARSATEQAAGDLRAALAIIGEGLAPEATRRDA